MSDFETALEIILAHEGGYVNHPNDKGGPTKQGITQRVYDAFRAVMELPLRTVRHITISEVELIYRRQYWDAIRGDELPAGIDLAVFDYAVNSGVSRGAKELQRVLKVKVDGHIGMVTIAAAKAADPAAVVKAICDRRLAFLKGLRKLWPTFGRGWTARVKKTCSTSLKMAKAA